MTSLTGNNVAGMVILGAIWLAWQGLIRKRATRTIEGTLAGLALPDTNTSRDDYSCEQRLSVALLYLMSQFARKLLNGIDRAAAKAIVLDEAWATASTMNSAQTR